MTFWLFFAIGLFIGAVLLAITRMVRAPQQGSWLISVLCSVVAYWGLMVVLILALRPTGFDPLSVRQSPLGALAFFFDAYTFGLPTFGALLIGVRLAPNRRTAFALLSSLSLLWSIWEFVGDSQAGGHLASLWIPVASLLAIGLAGWLMGDISPADSSTGSRASGSGKHLYSQAALQNSTPSMIAKSARELSVKTTDHRPWRRPESLDSNA